MNKRIFFFNSYLKGGAANAAINTFNLLSELDQYDLRFFYKVNVKESEVLNSSPYKNNFFEKNPIESRNWKNRIHYSLRFRYLYWLQNKYLNDVPQGYDPFTFSKHYYNTPIQWFGETPDIIHLNWVVNWLDYESFFNSIPDKTPIIWTLHDMNPFTCGCHYSWDCKQYKTLDFNFCPQINKHKNGALAKRNLHLRRKSLMNKNIHVVGGSKWITEEAKSSLIFSNAKSFQTIHCSIDFSVFKPKNARDTLLSKLNINDSSFIIAIGAVGVNSRRKGIEQLLVEMNKSNNNCDVSIIVFGNSNEENFIAFDNLNIFMTGSLTPTELSEVYSATDLMIIPSLQEAFGLVAIESMACGTPVLAFDVGGLKDSIIPDKTGWLVEAGNFKEIQKQIDVLKNEKNKLKNCGRNAIQNVRDNFSKEKEKRKYIELYEKVLK